MRAALSRSTITELIRVSLDRFSSREEAIKNSGINLDSVAEYKTFYVNAYGVEPSARVAQSETIVRPAEVKPSVDEERIRREVQARLEEERRQREAQTAVGGRTHPARGAGQA